MALGHSFDHHAANRAAAAFIASGCALGALLGYIWDRVRNGG